MNAVDRQDIPVGRSNAISRRELARKWGVDDRSARFIVSRMRKEQGDGYAILSSSRQPSGYWRSNDPEEIRHFIRETEARAKNTFDALRDARRVLRETEIKRDYSDGVLWKQ